MHNTEYKLCPIICLYVSALMVFTIFGCLFVEKMENKFLLASLKSLTNSVNPSSSPLQETCSGFRIATCTLKVVPKAAYYSEIVTKAGFGMYTVLYTIFRIKEANRDFFSLSQSSLKI